jgi:hypothetical protein|mmetsp:Transcript_3446/g.6613  ORF Transcript_3446/g.6613 Transcript_3446/m.6613 type:complete len:109 (+) Transcript_3446:2214-2540(+)
MHTRKTHFCQSQQTLLRASHFDWFCCDWEPWLTVALTKMYPFMCIRKHALSKHGDPVLSSLSGIWAMLVQKAQGDVYENSRWIGPLTAAEGQPLHPQKTQPQNGVVQI